MPIAPAPRPPATTPRPARPRPPAATYIADTYHDQLPAAPPSAAALTDTTDTTDTTGLSSLALVTPDDETPPATPRRLVAVCGYAVVVGLVGLALAIWSATEVLVGSPSWFLPAASAVGLIGFTSTLTALTTVRRPSAPWLLLALATCALAASIYLIETADAARATAAL